MNIHAPQDWTVIRNRTQTEKRKRKWMQAPNRKWMQKPNRKWMKNQIRKFRPNLAILHVIQRNLYATFAETLWGKENNATMKFFIWKISYIHSFDFFFSRLHRLKHHVNTIHLEERPLKCKFCSCQTSFEQESRLKCHISRVHKNDLVRLIRLHYLAKATGIQSY